MSIHSIYNRVWKYNGKEYSPVRKPFNPIRLYSLYRKENNRWIRISDNAYSEKLAYRVFCDRLSVPNHSIRLLRTIEVLSAQ